MRRRSVALAAFALALAGCQTERIREAGEDRGHAEPNAQTVPELYGVITWEGRGIPNGRSDGIVVRGRTGRDGKPWWRFW